MGINERDWELDAKYRLLLETIIQRCVRGLNPKLSFAKHDKVSLTFGQKDPNDKFHKLFISHAKIYYKSLIYDF